MPAPYSHLKPRATAQPGPDHRRRLICGGGLLAAAAALGVPRATRATNPPTLVYGYAQGSAADGVLAAVLKGLQARYEPATASAVRYIPGKGSVLAARAVRNGPSDGSLILCGPSNVLTLAPQLDKGTSAEPLAGLQPVLPLGRLTFAVVAGPRVPAHVTTLQQLKAWFAENPDQAGIGLPGVNTASHFLALELEERLALGGKLSMYQGSGAIIPDLASGSLPAALVFSGSADPALGNGKLRCLAIASRARWPSLPGCLTTAEQGAVDTVAEETFGLHVHPDTPPARVRQLYDATRAVLADPKVNEAMRAAGWVPLDSTPSPAEFRNALLAESQVWARRIAATQAKR